MKFYIAGLVLMTCTGGVVEAAELTAAEIASRALESNLLSTSNARANLELVVERRGKVVRRRKISSMVRRDEAETRSLVEFTAPPDVAGTKFLSIQPRGEDAQQFIFLPAFKKVKRVVGAQRNRSFMGTDFSYSDLEGRDVDSAAWRRLPDAKVGPVAVYVVEGSPKSPKKEQYGRSVLYVHKEHFVPMRIDFFEVGATEVLQKQFKVKRLEKRGARWIASDSAMSTVKKATRTRMRLTAVDFDTELSKAKLSRAALER